MSILMHFSHSVWLNQTKRHLEKSQMRFYVLVFIFIFSLPLSLSFLFINGLCLPNAMPHNKEYDMMANTKGDFGLVFILFRSQRCQYVCCECLVHKSLWSLRLKLKIHSIYSLVALGIIMSFVRSHTYRVIIDLCQWEMKSIYLKYECWKIWSFANRAYFLESIFHLECFSFFRGTTMHLRRQSDVPLPCQNCA